jgi:hypothetical protein
LYFVAVDAILSGSFQRFAIHFDARRQSDFRYQHVVTANPIRLCFDKLRLRQLLPFGDQNALWHASKKPPSGAQFEFFKA